MVGAGHGISQPEDRIRHPFQTPGSAIAYYQQMGRAGHAVDESFGVAMSGWEDIDTQDWFISTAFPSEDDCNLVLDRLAASLGLEPVNALKRIRESRPQKTMQNSFQQTQNVVGSFTVVDHRPGPVLLFDDVVDSRWTLTIVAAQRISAGSGPVYPLALADTSGEGS